MQKNVKSDMGINCGIKSWHDGGINDSSRTRLFTLDDRTKVEAHRFLSNNIRIMPRVSRSKRDTMVCRTILDPCVSRAKRNTMVCRAILESNRISIHRVCSR